MSATFRHDAGLYEGDEGLLSLLVPFAQDGAAAGEPVVFALHDRHSDLLRPALAGVPGVTFLPFVYACPAATVRTLLDLFERQTAGDGGRMRIVGEIHEPTLATWEPWARYEAAVNRLCADFDVWALCAYDLHSTPSEVLDDVACTHPRIATAGGSCRPSDGYQSPETFLTARPEPPADPLERLPPALELIDPGAALARQAVAGLASEYGCLAQEQVNSLSFGLSEAVTNAHLHGRPPVWLRLWAAPDRIHAAVTDAGAGLSDPFAGLRPAASPGKRGGGLGLWISHLICDQVTHAHRPDGFTVRLTARA